MVFVAELSLVMVPWMALDTSSVARMAKTNRVATTRKRSKFFIVRFLQIVPTLRLRSGKNGNASMVESPAKRAQMALLRSWRNGAKQIPHPRQNRGDSG